MGSMSYCRFENTAIDFENCVDDLRNNKPLSGTEEWGRKKLYELAKEYIDAYERYSPKPEEDEK